MQNLVNTISEMSAALVQLSHLVEAAHAREAAQEKALAEAKMQIEVLKARIQDHEAELTRKHEAEAESVRDQRKRAEKATRDYAVQDAAGKLVQAGSTVMVDDTSGWTVVMVDVAGVRVERGSEHVTLTHAEFAKRVRREG